MMGAVHRPPQPWHATGMLLIVLEVILIMILITPPRVATAPIKLRMEPLDSVDIVTSIKNQDVEDVLGLHDNNNTADSTSDDPNTTPLITTEGPPPAAEPLIVSPGSASVRDESGLIFEFPSRCPEGQKQDASGKCRKPFVPEDDTV